MDIAKSERIACLQLYRTKNIGAITFQKLLTRFGSAISALENLEKITSRHNKTIVPASISSIENEIERAQSKGISLLVQGDDNFPERFTHTAGLPPVLFVKGHAHILTKNSISIVGARTCSDMSGRFAYRIAQEVGKAGFTIVSGLARGIDTFAHQGSLETGTVAVLAGGVDICYPSENQKLYDQISEQGCLISEMAVGTKSSARLFPVRNRLVAGLSIATCVMEAELKSGSLITARLANEMSRDVFAVPGSPWDSRSRGCNKLIKDGAYPLEMPDDIFNTISLFNNVLNSTPASDFDAQSDIPTITDIDAVEVAKKILDILISSPRDVNSIIRESKYPAAIVKGVLLEMELTENIKYDHTGLCSLLASPCEDA